MGGGDPLREALKRHLGVTDYGAALWDDFICKRTFGSDPLVFDAVADIRNLEKMERALTALADALGHSSMTQSAQDELMRTILWGPFLGPMKAGEQLPSNDFEDYIADTGQPAAHALEAIMDSLPVIRKGIAETKKTVVASPDSRKGVSRINLRGIQLVGAARDTWELVLRKKPPENDVNMASKFGCFLGDLFDALEIEGDPRAAFRAWKALVHT